MAGNAEYVVTGNKNMTTLTPRIKKAKCEECRVERFLMEAHSLLPTMFVRTQLEDTTRTLFCLGCKHYLFETDNFKPIEGGK